MKRKKKKFFDQDWYFTLRQISSIAMVLMSLLDICLLDLIQHTEKVLYFVWVYSYVRKRKKRKQKTHFECKDKIFKVKFMEQM